MRVENIPENSALQYGSAANGTAVDNVNLFRGAVGFRQALLSLPGRNGVGISLTALYQGDVDKVSAKRNLESPTGVMGLGWYFSPARIVCEDDLFLPAGLKRYYLAAGSSRSPLYLLNEKRKLGGIDLGFIADLDKGTVTAGLIAAFGGNAFILGASALVESCTEGIWRITDPEEEMSYLLERESTEIGIYDGGLLFEGGRADFSATSYYEDFQVWRIVRSDGITELYGGKGEGVICYSVCYGGHYVPSAKVLDEDKRLLQSRVPTEWNLASQRTILGDSVVYSYSPVSCKTAENGLEYTKACYLARIDDMFGNSVVLDYGDKLFDASTPESAREYADRYRMVPDEAPNMHQSRYETKFLRSMDALYPDGTLIRRLVFDYDVVSYVTDMRNPYLEGDCAKRLLRSIRTVMADGSEYPPEEFSYCAGENAGALASIRNQNGATIGYQYAASELPGCRERVFRIYPPVPDASSRTVVGENYVAVVWNNGGVNRVELFTWTGRWVKWTAEDVFSHYALEDIGVIAGSSYVLVYGMGTSTTEYAVYSRDPDDAGDWISSGRNTVVTSRCYFYGGSDFFIKDDFGNREMSCSYYDGCEKAMRTVGLLTGAYAEGHRYLISCSTDCFALLSYDYQSGSSNSLSIYSAGEALGCSLLASTAVEDIFIAGAKGVPSQPLYGLTFGKGMVAGAFVEQNFPSGFNYDARVWLLEGSSVRETFANTFRCFAGAAEDVRDDLWKPLATAGRLVGFGGNALRYNGEKWLVNISLSPPIPPAGQSGDFYCAHGDDFLISSQIDDSTVTCRALVFDPEENVDSWDVSPINLYSGASIDADKGRYRVSASEYFATFDKTIYDMQAQPGREPFPVAYGLALPDDVDSSTLTNCGTEYLACMTEDRKGDRTGTLLYSVRNGELYPDTSIPEFYEAPTDEEAMRLQSQISSSGAAFYTVETSERGTTLSLSLYYFAGASALKSMVSYQVAAVDVDDGFETTRTRYSYDTDSAACDETGQFVRYYRVRTCSGDGASGFTEYRFSSGIAEGRRVDAALDGQLESVATYNSKGDLMSETTATYALSDSVEDPITHIRRRIHGYYVCSARSNTERDGVVSSLSYEYSPSSGNCSSIVTESFNGSGEKEARKEARVYGYEVYPELWYLNELNTEARRVTTVSTGEDGPFTVSDHVSLLKPWRITAGGKERFAHGLSEETVLDTYLDEGRRTTLKVIARSDSGMATSTEAPLGMRSSAIHDKRGIAEVARFSLADIEAGEAFFYGFEEYEQQPDEWTFGEGAATCEQASHTGGRCLKVSPGFLAGRLTLDVSPNYQDYLISFWSKCPSDGLSLRIIREGGMETVAIEPGADWRYTFKRVVLSQRETVVFEVYNLSPHACYIDDICFHILQAPPLISVYDKFCGHLTSVLSGYSECADYVYDSFGRKLAQISNMRSAVAYEIPYCSKDPQEHNSVFYAKPSRDVYYDRFFDDGGFAANWAVSDQSQWTSGAGRLIYAGKGGTAELMAVAIEENIFAGFHLEDPGADGFALHVGNDISMEWHQGRWSLREGGAVTAELDALCGRELALYAGKIVLLLSDGRPLFKKTTTAQVTGRFAFAASEGMSVRNLFCGADAQLGIHFADKTGKVRQGHSLEKEGVTITQTLYDDSARAIIATKPVHFAYDEAFRPLEYRDGLVESFDPMSGIMTGSLADAFPEDEGYPYSRQLLEDSPLGRVVEKGSPGKRFAIRDRDGTPALQRHTEKTAYKTNTIPIPGWDIPLQQYLLTCTTDANGHIRESYSCPNGLQVASLAYDNEGLPLITTSTTKYHEDYFEETVYYPNHYRDPPPGGRRGDGEGGGGDNGDSVNRFTSTTQATYGNQVVRVTSCDGGTTTMFYDSLQRERFVQDEANRKGGIVRYKKYDSFSRITEEGNIRVDWDSELKRKAMDSPEYPTEQDGAIRSSAYLYDDGADNAGRLGRLVKTQHYSQGHLSSVTTVDYDLYSRVSAETVAVPVAAPETVDSPLTHRYSYDCNDTLTSTTYSDGGSAIYDYDQAGRIRAVRDETGKQVCRFEYFANDLLRTATYGGSGQVEYSYNSQGWIERISSPLMEEDVVYEKGDEEGPFNGRVSETTVRLKGEPPLDLCAEIKYQVRYDARGQLVGAACYMDGRFNPDYSIGFNKSISYDANGNVVETESNEKVKRYLYEPGTNKLTGTEDDPDQYEYDGNGSVVRADPHGIECIKYDERGCPEEIRAGGKTVKFIYDSGGKRLAKIDSDSSRIYLRNAAGKVLEEVIVCSGTGRSSRAYLYGPRGLCSVREKDDYRYFHTDHLGSSRVVSDGSGVGLSYMHYSSYGEIIGTATDTEDVLCCFTGYEFDKETGLYCAGRRLFDPSIGRFYSIDSAGEFSSPYIYCGNDPFSLIDPQGDSSWWAILVGAVCGVLLTLAGGVAGFVVASAFAAGSAAATAATIVAGTLAGAAGGIVGTTVTALVENQPISGKMLLSSLASGAASGLVGGGVGLIAKGVSTIAYNAMRSFFFVATTNVLIAGAGGGLAAGLASGIVGAAVSGDSLAEGRNWINIATGAMVGMGVGMIVSSGMYALFGIMPVEVDENAKVKDAFNLRKLKAGVSGTLKERASLLARADSYFTSDKTFFASIPEAQIMETGTAMLRAKIDPFAAQGTAPAVKNVVAVHGWGRWVFPLVESPGGEIRMTQMSTKSFASWLRANGGLSGCPTRTEPVKLYVCFSAFGYKGNCGAQVLARILGTETFGTRGVTYPIGSTEFLSFSSTT